MEIYDWKRIFDAIENKLTKSNIFQVIKAKLLNAVRTNDRDILEQIKVELQKQFEVVYKEWEQKGFDINHLFNVSWTISPWQQPDQKSTLLHIAVRFGHLKIVKYLIDEKDADPNLMGHWSNNSLRLATIEGHLEIVKYLIDEKRIDSNLRGENGHTLLHLATHLGHLEIVKYLIDEKNADPHFMGHWSNDSLYLAAIEGHLEIVKYLIDEKKIGPGLRNDYRGVLLAATKGGHLEVVKYFIDEKKIDPSLRDKYDQTPLHVAARENHLEVVKYLVDEKKIDPSLRDKYDQTPLHLAALNISLEIVQYLIEKGAKVDEKAADGWTPLHFAATRGYPRIIKYLIDEKNADPSLKNNSRETPLCHAVNSNLKRSAELLIKYEVKKNSNAKKPEYLENTEEMSKYWDTCLDEIEKMKQKKTDQDITLYDILVSKNNRLASFIRNERMMDVLEKNCYKSEFPTYANDLKLQFKVGRQRLDDLNIGETVTRHFGVFMGKEGPFNLRIAEYLNNKDLKNLKKAAVQTMDEGDCKLEIREEIPKSLSNLNVENLNEVVRSARRA